MFRVLCLCLGLLLLPQAAPLNNPIFSAPQAVTAESAAPTTLSPTGVITPLRMVTFEWRAQPETVWYYLWVSTPTGGGINQWYEAANICQMEICTVTPGLPLQAGLYRWWVKAWSPLTGYSAWSSETQYIVTTPAPVLMHPSGVVQTAQPNFQWYASPNASWYYLWLSGPNGVVVSQWFPATNCFAGVCVLSTLLLPPGEYRWWVQAWQEHGGYSPWSAPLAFTVADDVILPPPPDGIELTPDVTSEPTAEVTATLEPTEEITATAAPTEEVTAEPTVAPTEEVTATAAPTEEVTAEPTAVTETPAATVEAATPTVAPTAEVTPEATDPATG